MRPAPRLTVGLGHPTRVVASGFGSAILVGTVLLALPAATASGERAHIVDSLFTATSAVCVTGLVTVDTGSDWSLFGQLVILGLIQVGGIGIMTLATLFAVLLSGRLGLRASLFAQTEMKATQLTGVRQLVTRVVMFSLCSELVVAAFLTVRFATAYDKPIGPAAYDGVFHSISAFNNAGFSLNSDSLIRFVGDPWVIVPVMVAFVVGGLGFPVVFELLRSWRRPKQWSVLTRLTVGFTGVLLAVGTLVLTATEFRNDKTLGPLDLGDKMLAGMFASATARTAGFNSIDVTAMRPESWFVTDILMFIGGGSAGTAGGIKVTTFGLLMFVIWTQMRGERDVHVGRRMIAEANYRQALTIALLGIGLIASSTCVLLMMTPHRLDVVLFEVVSAFGTVGLSAGITADLPRAAHVLLALLMFVGRIGPLTLASALALRERARRFQLPEERTIVG